MKELKKKKSTKELVLTLKKTAKRRNEKIWIDLAKRLSKPSRKIARMNIEKIARIASKNKGKLLVVPGKVLGKGELNEGIHVSAFAFSDTAREKINAKGSTMDLLELIDSKKKAGEIIIVL